MSIALEVHWGFAFFVLFIALFVGWVQMGRRTMIGVIGVQVLIGIVLAAWMGAAHRPIPPVIGYHIVAALLAMAAYIVGRRMYDRSPQNAWQAIAFSFLGFVLVCVTLWIGWGMVYPVHGYGG